MTTTSPRPTAAWASLFLESALLLCGAAAPGHAAWQSAPSLPAAYMITQSVATGNFVYKLGGLGEKGVCGTPDILVAAVNADGSLGAWTPTTPLPHLSAATRTVAVTCAGVTTSMDDIILGWGYSAVYWNGFIYLLGGNRYDLGQLLDGGPGPYITFFNGTFYAKVNADGSLGPWATGPNLPDNVFTGAAAVANGVIYVVGGRDDASTSFVQPQTYYARVNADGSLGAWKTAASLLPNGLWYHALAATDAALYVSGGETANSQVTNGVLRAPINLDGSIGAWQTASALPTGTLDHGMLVRNGILYTVGGEDPDGVPTASVYVSSIAADGSLPPWTMGDPLPQITAAQGNALSRTDLFAVGGTDFGFGTGGPYRNAWRLPDAIPPAAVPDLAGQALDSSSIQLRWTATGNDGAYGSVHGGRNILRYSANRADFASFDAIPSSASLPADYAPGQLQAYAAAGLLPGTTYYLGLKSLDQSGNSSDVSNVAAVMTYFLAKSTESPARATVESPYASLSIAGASAAQTNAALAAAQGTPASSIYSVSPSGLILNPSGIFKISYDPSLSPAGLALYQYIDSTVGWSSAAVTSQSVDPARFVVTGRTASTGLYALFSDQRPVPALASISPSSVTAGAAGFTLTVNGSNFRSASVVQWNGAAVATTFVSPSQLTAVIAAGAVASAGTDAVAVFTPAPGGGTSASASFVVLNPVPVLASLSPASALAGQNGLTLTVNGSGFVPGSVVRWNGASRATTYVSASQLTAAVSAADLASAGSFPVSVVTPAPGGGTSASASFSVLNPVPVVASLSPSTAAAGGAGFALSVNGSGFVPGSVVQWNGAAHATAFVSPAQLTANIVSADLAAAGTQSVTVFSPVPGGGTSAAAAFSVLNPVPALASLGMSSAPAGGAGFTLTLFGSNFVPASEVRWNGSPRATTYVSPSQLAATIASSDVSSTGSDGVAVFSPAPGGGLSSAMTFTVFTPPSPVPVLVSVSPTSALAGSSGATVTLSGSGFTAGSVAQWNGAARPTTYVDPTSLSATLSAQDLAAGGAGAWTVLTPAPGGGTSAGAAFTVINPAPALASLTPASAVAGGAALSLSVNGSSFVPGSVVRWNGADRPTAFVSPAQLTASLAAADLAASGTQSVTVFSPAPGGGTSAAASFIVANPAPVLASVTPPSAIAGQGGLTLTVSGSGFAPSSVVQWNGADRATTFVGVSQLTAALSAADLASAGSFAVGIVTPAPGGGTSASASFVVLNPAPVLASLSPASALAGQAGLTLIVNGSGFTPSSILQWNGVARPTAYVGPTQLTAALSAADLASAGSFGVSVVTPAPGGGTSSAASFSVLNPAPVVSSLSPSAAAAGADGFTLGVGGSGFVPGSVVRWNGADRPTAFVSPTQLTVGVSSADLAVVGVDSVTVFTPAPGGGLSEPRSFTVANPTPVLTAVAPNSATAGAAGLTLTVAGARFVPGAVVRWNGADRPTAYVSAVSLSASVSAADLAAAGTADVSVVNPAPGGGASSSVAFTVLNPAPSLAALNPNAVLAGSGDFLLTLDGAGFVTGSVVQWNGTPRPTTYVGPARLTAAISASDVAAAGGVAVAVVNPAPGGGASATVAFAVVAPPVVLRSTVTPETLNLGSQGNFVKTRLEGLSGATADLIDAASVRIVAVDGSEVAPLAGLGAQLGDDDADGKPDLTVSFDRGAVSALLTPGAHALRFAGRLKDGRTFATDGGLRAISPSSGHTTARLADSVALGSPVRYWPAPASLLAYATTDYAVLRVISRLDDGSKARKVVSGQVAVRVPDGAVAPAVTLTISTAAAAVAEDLSLRKSKTAQEGFVEAAAPVAFGPEGTHFVVPVTLEMPYQRSTLPPGTDESSLAVHYWNPTTSSWEKIPSFVDRRAQVVRAQTGHFSLYQVLSSPRISTLPNAGPDASFSLRDAYAFPNPVRGASRVTLRIQPGQADSVEVRVYDVSGRKVHSSSDFADLGAFDDGNGKGAQFTYDHAWDVSGVGSGVYTYVITARKAGRPDLHKAGRVGVVK